VVVSLKKAFLHVLVVIAPMALAFLRNIHD
jgi:hypothetical protein